MGPITVDVAKLPEREEAFSQKTSIFFKHTRIYRIPDVKHNAIVYLAASSKIIAGELDQYRANHAMAEVPVRTHRYAYILGRQLSPPLISIIVITLINCALCREK
jgi:catabolite regulation protein CreA